MRENEKTADAAIEMHPVAVIHTPFSEKFGIPRQSNLAEVEATITFLPDYASPEAVRGLESFSHLWLLWCFSEHVDAAWHPTVRPPRLGGNERVGVFASRSPFRPNPIGLSCVTLINVETETPEGPRLHVRGADLVDGTPILDIKPYLSYTDSHPDATGGFTEEHAFRRLQVQAEESVLSVLPEADRRALLSVLAEDPRPAYQDDPERIYGFRFAGCEVRFRVSGETLYLLSITSA